MEGKTEEKRGRGRRKTSQPRHLCHWYGISNTALLRTAANIVKITRMIANVLEGHGA